MKAALLLLSLLYITGTSIGNDLMVCYHGSWATYRPGNGQFDIEDIDPFICTHLVYGFAGLNHITYEIKVLDPWYEVELGAFDRFTGLKSQNPSLTTTLAVGGWNEGSKNYSDMAADPARRKTFIDSSIVLLKQHNFDGLDMDWEYPNNRGGVPADKENFVILLNELSVALKAEGMILTAAVAAGKATIDLAYNIPEVSAVLDYMHLMAYDLHGSWDPYTHHHTLLTEYSEDTGDNVYLNVEFALNYWIDQGADPKKIVLGSAAYGRSFTLSSTANTGMYAPSSGAGIAGPYTREVGNLGFNEICEKMMTESWNVVHEPEMNEPYASRDDQWVGYEDITSIAIKGAYGRSMGIAGMMLWSIETDDFLNICGLTSEKYPLIHSVYEAYLGGEIPTQPTTPTPDPNATTKSTTPTPPPFTVDPNDVCQTEGINYDEKDCTHYYSCTSNGSGYDATEMPCADGLLFNPQTHVCDWDYNVCAIDGACPNDCPAN